MSTNQYRDGNNYQVDSNATEIQITINSALLPHFQRLIGRGLNCWDEAPAEIKELGDLICDGRVLQDYKSQDTSKR